MVRHLYRSSEAALQNYFAAGRRSLLHLPQGRTQKFNLAWHDLPSM